MPMAEKNIILFIFIIPDMVLYDLMLYAYIKVEFAISRFRLATCHIRSYRVQYCRKAGLHSLTDV